MVATTAISRSSSSSTLPVNHRPSPNSRVPRACDRCRIRKIKCNGHNPCNRCITDDSICVFTSKKRPNDRAYSKEYVQLLEEQRDVLVRGVRELYRKASRGETLPELASDSRGESMLIHEVLGALGVLPKSTSRSKDSSDLDEMITTVAAEEEEQCKSSRASICESVPSSTHFASRKASSTDVPNTPILGVSSPISFGSDHSLSPPILPPGLNSAGQMNCFDSEPLQLFQYNMAPTYLQPGLKPPAMTADMFAEAFDEAYLANTNSGRGYMTSLEMGMGTRTSLPGDTFVNLMDMNYSMPIHTEHAYTT